MAAKFHDLRWGLVDISLLKAQTSIQYYSINKLMYRSSGTAPYKPPSSPNWFALADVTYVATCYGKYPAVALSVDPATIRYRTGYIATPPPGGGGSGVGDGGDDGDDWGYEEDDCWGGGGDVRTVDANVTSTWCDPPYEDLECWEDYLCIDYWNGETYVEIWCGIATICDLPGGYH